MLLLVTKKVLSFSLMVAMGFALLTLDTDSPSLISEAAACDQELFLVCYQNCGFACIGGAVQGCIPEPGICHECCTAICAAAAGCN